MTQRKFLTAEWKNLVMLNYAVDPDLLQPFVPSATKLDSFSGLTFVSLIGFEFNRTRIAGTPIPFHQSFEEVNLRFYVRRGDRRGVVFIRELVPRRAVVAVARALFGENYICTAMSHSLRINPASNAIEAEYSFGSGADRCTMGIETDTAPYVPLDETLAQFITEHYWGYARQKDGSCFEYEVQHPRWQVREAKTAKFDGNPTAFYGEEFASILKCVPNSAFLAEGSAVTVFRGTPISNGEAQPGSMRQIQLERN